MINAPYCLSKWQKRAFTLLVVFLALWAAYVFKFDIFLRPPGMETTDVFIGEAKPYYYEESSLLEKEFKFRPGVYRDLWLSVPGITEVATNYDIPEVDVDVLEGEEILRITYKGTTLDIPKRDQNLVQQQLYEEALNQVSAAAWERSYRRLIVDVAIWAAVAVAFAVWCAYIRKRALCAREQ